MNKRLYFISLMITMGLNVNAATTNKNVPVTAQIQTSCKLKATDVSFGVLPTEDISQALTVPSPLTLRCNKDLNMTISAIGVTNPQGNLGKFMTINNVTVPQTGDSPKPFGAGINYHLVPTAIQTNTDYALVYKSSSIIKNWGGAADYTLKIRAKTSDSFQLPIIAQINAADFNKARFSYKTGVYSDIVTISVEY
jgi:hypothetical protein